MGASLPENRFVAIVAWPHDEVVPTLTQLLAFAAASIVVIEIPGPSLLFAVGRALTVGSRDAIVSVAGTQVGNMIQVTAVAVGLGALVAASATAFTVVKLVGAAYVVYLGVQAIRHRSDARALLGQTRTSARASGWSAVRAGVVVGATNPKAIVFHMAFLPQFIDPHAPAAPQILLLGLLFSCLAFASDSCWTLVAGRAKAWLARKPKRLDGIGVAGGVMMIGLGGFLATSRQAA